MKKGLLIEILLGLVIGLMVGVSLTAYADSPDPWDDLQTRINNASSGATIKLSDGVKAGTNDSALTVPAGKTIILDLAGTPSTAD